jgi:hypothetical protein
MAVARGHVVASRRSGAARWPIREAQRFRSRVAERGQRGAVSVGDASERGRGGRERGKGAGERGTTVQAPCRGAEQSRMRQSAEGERRKGKADKRA